jgi:Flp pilus assembly protein TadG
MPKSTSSNRRSRQGGNTMVEVALTLIPTIAMFFGIIDVSLVVYLQSTLTHATREGARFGVTFSSTYGASSCATSQASCITQVVQTNAIGFLSGTRANLITVNYYTANDLSNPVETCNAGTCTQTGVLPQTLSNGKIVTYANQPGNIVEVVVNNYPWNWIVPISAVGYKLTAPSITLGASALDVLGGLAAGTTVPPTP